jgi:hypothetical protein
VENLVVSRQGQREALLAFTFTLEHEHGLPAEPPTLATAVPNRRCGDMITLGNDRTLHVIEIRPGPELDGDAVLIGETGLVALLALT